MFLRFLITALFLAGSLGAARAHRPGESYVYIDVTDDGLSGEFHIRLEDVAKAFDLDRDGDGITTEAEVAAGADSIRADLAGRLFFFRDGERHAIAPTALEFFGHARVRQMRLKFDVPGFGPPPEAIDVEYRFLYDGADPDHRPMLLQASNTRMRLAENEATVSLVFEPGAERQTVSLVPPPRGPLFLEFLLHGVRQILGDPDRLLLAVALLLPVVARRRPGRWDPFATLKDSVRNAAVAAAAFGGGLAAALIVLSYVPFRGGPLLGDGLLALSLILVAVDNFRPLPGLARWHVAALAGALQGAGRNDYGGFVGLNGGLVEAVPTGFGAGAAVAVLAVALVIVPALILVRDLPIYRLAALRLGSVALVGVSAAWFTTKLA
jgi:hypothetical protein